MTTIAEESILFIGIQSLKCVAVKLRKFCEHLEANFFPKANLYCFNFYSNLLLYNKMFFRMK